MAGTYYLFYGFVRVYTSVRLGKVRLYIALQAASLRSTSCTVLSFQYPQGPFCMRVLRITYG